MDFFFLLKCSIEYFPVLFPLSTSRFVRVLLFCLAHLLPFLGAVTLPWLLLMGENLSVLLFPDLHTFSVYLGVAGWFDYNLHCLKGVVRHNFS